MMVLVDTSAWSLALRRKQADLSPEEQGLKTALQELLQDGRAQIVGPVRQNCFREYGQKIVFTKCATLCAPSTSPNSRSRIMKKRRASAIFAASEASPGQP